MRPETNIPLWAFGWGAVLTIAAVGVTVVAIFGVGLSPVCPKV